jgi:hypothetical protein
MTDDGEITKADWNQALATITHADYLEMRQRFACSLESAKIAVRFLTRAANEDKSLIFDKAWQDAMSAAFSFVQARQSQVPNLPWAIAAKIQNDKLKEKLHAAA